VTEKIYVHASSLGTWHDDPRRWAADNLDTKKPSDDEAKRPTTTIGAIIGNNAHAAAALMLNTKADGFDVDIDGCVEMAVEQYRADCKKVKIEIDAQTKNQGDGEIQMVKQILAWSRGYLPTSQPLYVEMKLQRDIPNTDIVLVGQPDVIEDLGNHRYGIDDHKFGGQASVPGAQMGAYVFIVEGQEWFLPGSEIERIRKDQTNRVGKDKPQPDTIIMPLNLRACVMLAKKQLEEIQRCVTEYRETGDIWAFNANPRSMYCNATSCKVFGTEFCDQGGTEID
jgi:hypothetical protein